MIFNGLFELTFFQLIIITLSLTYLTVVSVTLYLHRFSSHRSLELHPVLQHFFRFWLWLTTAMNTKEWTAIHRKHHAKCETEEDPHSPVFKGIKNVLFRGLSLYRQEAKNQETIEKYGKGTPNDWVEKNIYSRNKGSNGILIMLAIDVLFFGVSGIAIWALQIIWMPLFAAGIVNGLGHYLGYRNFETSDTSTNLIPWGGLLGGEELHNNHHAFPNSAKFSVKWWEFDSGWFWIKLFTFLRLAKVNVVKSKVKRDLAKNEIDWDTVLAVFNNRVQIMAQYSKQVIKPLLKKEKETAAHEERYLFRQARKLLTRDQDFIKPIHLKRINVLLDKHATLEMSYALRIELQSIWKKTTASQQELLIALKEWCQKAEQSGIKMLQDFASAIKSYSLQPAKA